MITNKRIVNSGSSANVANKYMRHLIQDNWPCDGNIVGAGGRIIGAIVGKGLLRVLGIRMIVYYGPNMPKSVFSVGVFTGDHRFEMTFKRDSCFTRVPAITEECPGIRDC